MSKLQTLIDKKGLGARYMMDEITKIIKTLPKRDPGSEGEKVTCEYMADVLKNDCGCEDVKIESFKENPGSFYGWLYITLTCMLIAVVTFFLKLPWLSIILIVFGLLTAVLQFGLYFKFVDKLFPEKAGHNVTAIKKCTGETKRRIFFNGHVDAAWEWPVNYLLGGVGFESHAIIGFAGAFYYLALSIVQAATGSPLTKWALWGLLFVPFWIGLYFLWNGKRIVDGANDNLSGCYMGITLLKMMQDEGITLENTEVGVIITGSEEAGLRGAYAWADAHKNDYNDVPTFIISYDTIHDPQQLMVNYRNLNGTVKTDKDVGDLFFEAAEDLKIFCKKGMVPPLGGATDDAAFAKAGMRATGITGLNHKLENYYHTRRDTYDNMNEQGLADCYAVTVKALEMFDAGAKQ